MGMASNRHVTPSIALITACFIFAYTASARDIFIPIGGNGTTNNTVVNGTRMIGDCWTALYDVKSCSNEIASYFNNGTIDIGVSCCQAIKTITRDCWPNLLNVVGITMKERNVLRGYCDATHSSSAPVVDPVFQEPGSVNIINGSTI